MKSLNQTHQHLVKHSTEWMRDLDSIIELDEKIAAPLLWIDHGHAFLTPGAMDMGPKDLLKFEREKILDMPFGGLEDLVDTQRVKLLRSWRAVQDAERQLNTTLLHLSWLEGSWGRVRSVRATLIDDLGEVVAVAEFLFIGGLRIRTKNDGEPDIEVDSSLVELCKLYHDDFLYGWRLEILKNEFPERYEYYKSEYDRIRLLNALDKWM